MYATHSLTSGAHLGKSMSYVCNIVHTSDTQTFDVKLAHMICDHTSDLTVAATWYGTRLFIPESREQRHNLSDFGDVIRKQTATEMVRVRTVIRMFIHRQCEASKVCFNNGQAVVTKAQHIPSPDRSVDERAGRCCRYCFPSPQVGPNWPRVPAWCRSDDACIDTFHA
jgi:hypothetical protein